MYIVAAILIIICIGIVLVITYKWNKENNNKVSLKENIRKNIAEFKRILTK